MTTPFESWIKNRLGVPVLTREAIDDYQRQKLREVVQYAFSNSRFYSEHFSDALKSGSYDCFANLPMTKPADISGDPQSFLCVSPKDVSRIVTLNTSGTTGESKRIFFTNEDQELTVDFFHHGMSTLTMPNDKVMIFMPGKSPGGIGELLIRGLKRLGADGYVYGPISDYADAKSEFIKYAPNVVVGLPSQVYRLACMTKGQVEVKSSLLASDYISPHVQTLIEFAWDCKVFKHYGMVETGLGGAVTCELSDGYHIRELDLYIEIIDPDTGDVLPDGEYGEIVFTTLTRYAMPLIRYRTGDRSGLLKGACECGSLIKRLDEIQGRYADNIILKSGKVLSISGLDDIILASPNVLAYSAKLLGGTAEVLELTIETLDNASDYLLESIQNLPNLKHFGVKVIIKKGPVDFYTTGTLKRKIIDNR